MDGLTTWTEYPLEISIGTQFLRYPQHDSLEGIQNLGQL